MDSHPEKVFEWYASLVELGNFEVEHGRERFYETLKIHVAIAGGILAMMSYAAVNKQWVILPLAAIVAIFGTLNARFWRKQIEASSPWESRWRQTVAAIEDMPEFRAAVGMSSVKAWSHNEVAARLDPAVKKAGATPSFYLDSVNSFRRFYIILALFSLLGVFIILMGHACA